MTKKTLCLRLHRSSSVRGGLHLVALIVCCTAASLAAATQPAADDIDTAAIDALFSEFDQTDSPGAVVGIYRGGDVAYARGYGMASLEHGAKLTPDTTIHVASVSKQFTAFGVALLAAEGRLDLQADVRNYLPYVPDFGTTITVGHLVHHTSGLRDQWGLFEIGGQDMRNVLTQEQVRAMVKRQQSLNFTPGTDYLYSNTGYTLLAEIIQAVTGESMADYLNRRVFEPLGMRSTFFLDDLTDVVDGRSESYVRRADGSWGRVPLNYETVGATSLFTTVNDFGRWAGNLSGGTIGGKEMIERVTTMGELRTGEPINYGFGLYRSVIAGHDAVLHTGGDAAFVTVFVHFPDESLSFAVFVNTPGALSMRTIVELTRVLLGGSDGVPLREELSGKGRAAYAGDFLSKNGRLLSLREHGDRLQMSFNDGSEKAVVFRMDGTFDPGYERRVRFHYFRPVRNADGAVTEIEELRGNGRDTWRLATYRAVKREVKAGPALEEYLGAYYSSELDVTYEVESDGDCLSAATLWDPKPIVLCSVVGDRFVASSGALRSVLFVREASGHVNGMEASSSRVLNLTFQRTASR